MVLKIIRGVHTNSVSEHSLSHPNRYKNLITIWWRKGHRKEILFHLLWFSFWCFSEKGQNNYHQENMLSAWWCIETCFIDYIINLARIPIRSKKFVTGHRHDDGEDIDEDFANETIIVQINVGGSLPTFYLQSHNPVRSKQWHSRQQTSHLVNPTVGKVDLG